MSVGITAHACFSQRPSSRRSRPCGGWRCAPPPGRWPGSRTALSGRWPCLGFFTKGRLLKSDAAARTPPRGLSGAPHLGLTGDLGRQLGVGQAAGGEDGQLLPPHQGVQPVNGGNPRLDKLLGIVPGRRVRRAVVDIATCRKSPVPIAERPRPSSGGSMSSLTPSSMLRPKKRTLLLSRLMPVELSNSCTRALPSLISSTLLLPRCRSLPTHRRFPPPFTN